MRTLTAFSLLLLIAAGCASGDSASGAKPTETSTATVASEKAKCELCGTEVPKAELAMHDGKMACKACIASHNH